MHGQLARLAISRQSQPAMLRHRRSRIPSGFGLAKSNDPVIAGACPVGNGSMIAGSELSAESSRGNRHASEMMLINCSLSKFRPLTTAIEVRPCSRLGSASKAASAPPRSVPASGSRVRSLRTGRRRNKQARRGKSPEEHNRPGQVCNGPARRRTPARPGAHQGSRSPRQAAAALPALGLGPLRRAPTPSFYRRSGRHEPALNSRAAIRWKESASRGSDPMRFPHQPAIGGSGMQRTVTPFFPECREDRLFSALANPAG